MELTGTLKAKVEAAKCKEDKKAIIAQAGMMLTDDELNEVSGGFKSLEALTQDDICESRSQLEKETINIGSSK